MQAALDVLYVIHGAWRDKRLVIYRVCDDTRVEGRVGFPIPLSVVWFVVL